MGFESILGERAQSKDAWDILSMPAAFYDLNLNTVMRDIKYLHKEYRIEQYYYMLPGNKADIRYRLGVFRDLEKERLFEGIVSFSNDMVKAGKYKSYEEKSVHLLQQACWSMDGAFFYTQAILRLYRCLVNEKPEGEAFQSLREYLKKETESETFRNLMREAEYLMDKISRTIYHLELSHNRIIIGRAKRGEPWDEKADRLLDIDPESLPEYAESPFAGILRLSDLEYRLLDMIEKSDREAFAGFHTFYKKYHDYMNPVIIRFEQEVQFYISFRKFIDPLKEQGFPFAYPKITEDRFAVKGCYDIALANKNRVKGLPVVPNDLEYGKGEKFFVITGPNQGGKTTFARAIGQAAYFAMLGVLSPCAELDIPLLENILTHFAAEESMDTGAGKLKEELNRLAPMINNKAAKNLVLINELFTTAATYDAYIMGNRVMRHFIKKECMGIYVTHIGELAKEEDGIVSLAAEVDEKDSHVRTYKINRRQAEGSGYAADVVEKHHLSYEDIRRRLKI